MFNGRAAYLSYLQCCSDGLGVAEVFFSVNFDATVGADKFRVFVQLVDLLVECCRLQLTHIQFTVFLRV